MFHVLSQDEQDEMMAAFLLAQERDEFSHQVNLNRYERMLSSLAPGQWRDRIQRLRDETAQRLTEVRSILEATEPQLPPEDRLKLAVDRLRLRGPT